MKKELNLVKLEQQQAQNNINKFTFDDLLRESEEKIQELQSTMAMKDAQIQEMYEKMGKMMGGNINFMEALRFKHDQVLQLKCNLLHLPSSEDVDLKNVNNHKTTTELSQEFSILDLSIRPVNTSLKLQEKTDKIKFMKMNMQSL